MRPLLLELLLGIAFHPCSSLYLYNATSAPVDASPAGLSNASSTVIGLPMEIGSAADWSERTDMYTFSSIHESLYDVITGKAAKYVTAEASWILPNSTTPGAACLATMEDLKKLKGKIVVYHSTVRTKYCDTSMLLWEMEDAGIVGAIQLQQLNAVAEMTNIVSLIELKLPPQVLFLPGSHTLATEMGCPEVCSGEASANGGSDECTVPQREHKLYVTMSYAHDPWIDYLGSWLMVVPYFIATGLFLWAGVLAQLSLKFLPKFKAKWTPKYCTTVLVFLQDSRGVALKFMAPYTVCRLLDMLWGQLYFRAWQGYMPTFGVLQKFLWSMPLSFGMVIVNMQLLHWAQMCDAGSMKGMSETIRKRRAQLVTYSLFMVAWTLLYNIMMTFMWGSLLLFFVWLLWALFIAANCMLCGIGFLIFGSKILKALNEGMKSKGGASTGATTADSAASKKARMQSKSIIKLTRYVMVSAAVLMMIFLGVVWQIIAQGSPGWNYVLSRVWTTLWEGYFATLLVFNLSPVTYKKLYDKKYKKKKRVVPKSVVETANSMVESDAGGSTMQSSATGGSTTRTNATSKLSSAGSSVGSSAQSTAPESGSVQSSVAQSNTSGK